MSYTITGGCGCCSPPLTECFRCKDGIAPGILYLAATGITGSLPPFTPCSDCLKLNGTWALPAGGGMTTRCLETIGLGCSWQAQFDIGNFCDGETLGWTIHFWRRNSDSHHLVTARSTWIEAAPGLPIPQRENTLTWEKDLGNLGNEPDCVALFSGGIVLDPLCFAGVWCNNEFSSATVYS